MAENVMADRYAMAQAVRIAVWGKPEDMKLLQPQARPRLEDDNTTDALAAFGLREVTADE